MLTSVFIDELGFWQSAVDHSIFYRRSKEEHTIVVVATDNMALTLKQATDIEKFKSKLGRHFEITDTREIHWFLGFEVKCDRAARTISINQ